jgi:tRNA(adenine34) deaminase
MMKERGLAIENEAGKPKRYYYYMRQVFELASEALEEGELPIASIVVLDDRIVSRATTSEKRERRLLGHAELSALEIADKAHLSYEQRRRAELYTNLEPCMMCMGACMSFSLGEIIYSLESPGDGAVELVRSWVRKEEDIPGYQTPRISGGILREESITLFKRYVNQHQPGPMRDWAETLASL